jgi:hypothetical protein
MTLRASSVRRERLLFSRRGSDGSDREMRLPGGAAAIVEPAKVREYLLSTSHVVGRFKARFFSEIGYAAADWERLSSDLRRVAASGDARTGPADVFGRRYEVRATLGVGSGRPATVVTIWIIRPGETAPRFVTAYPG